MALATPPSHPPLEVVQPPNQPLKVADAVAVCIHKGSNGQAVENGVLVLKIIDHFAALFTR